MSIEREAWARGVTGKGVDLPANRATELLDTIASLRKQVTAAEGVITFVQSGVNVIHDHHTRPRNERGNTSVQCRVMQDEIAAYLKTKEDAK